MSVREYINAAVKPLLPSVWIFHDYDKTISNIGKVTCVVVHKSVEPAPHQGSLNHTVSLVILDPTQAEKTMDDHLDDHMEDLIPVLQSVPNIQFLRADKGTHASGFPCWDVSLQIQTTA